MTDSVAILGCGYVGLELGRQLRDAGWDVVGVRRSDDGLAAVEAAGLSPVRADVTDRSSLQSVPDVDAVVFTVSAGGRSPEAYRYAYVEGLRTTIDAFAARESPPDRLVYTSSTGVYGDHDGAWVDEETPPDPNTERGEVLLEAESVALETSAAAGIDGIVVRFAGLYGPGRYRLDRYLERPVTEGYLNLIHRDDAAGVIRFLLDEDVGRGETVLAVDDEPVSRWTLSDWLADYFEVERPPKQTVAERLANEDLSRTRRRRLVAEKRCSNTSLHRLGYVFSYPTFREGYRDAELE